MSPEQATGDRDVDARSDIYSLGAMVYEMLTGDPPHLGSTMQAIISKVLTETPAPISHTRDLVPTNVEAAVARALAKTPADRFSSAADFQRLFTKTELRPYVTIKVSFDNDHITVEDNASGIDFSSARNETFRF